MANCLTIIATGKTIFKSGWPKCPLKLKLYRGCVAHRQKYTSHITVQGAALYSLLQRGIECGQCTHTHTHTTERGRVACTLLPCMCVIQVHSKVKQNITSAQLHTHCLGSSGSLAFTLEIKKGLGSPMNSIQLHSKM